MHYCVSLLVMRPPLSPFFFCRWDCHPSSRLSCHTEFFFWPLVFMSFSLGVVQQLGGLSQEQRNLFLCIWNTHFVAMVTKRKILTMSLCNRQQTRTVAQHCTVICFHNANIREKIQSTYPNISKSIIDHSDNWGSQKNNSVDSKNMMHALSKYATSGDTSSEYLPYGIPMDQTFRAGRGGGVGLHNTEGARLKTGLSLWKSDWFFQWWTVYEFVLSHIFLNIWEYLCLVVGSCGDSRTTYRSRLGWWILIHMYHLCNVVQ